ncbi:hypothetical protein ACIQUM_24565 [Amycolatopsis azurea]|uniref:Uncharacterized protein n=1 Tax=Amycolatopsis azurea DSM 43854 TaxID=1238180 RepID=M2NN94_9PSEU|nr:hypothetical protein [Amycolatopsis azurea]EMD23644.1 hypothetical protein C791_6869 [Amycolatopsis azurea DSM 43854]OOC05793.1 hypothetical protein B0293_15715 [Amycolatopsis azurea DSM 43854]
MSQDHEQFAGDVLLGLAHDGRLVLDADEAEARIAELRRTLAYGYALLADPDYTGPEDRLRDILDELPKYVEAFQQATKSFTPR